MDAALPATQAKAEDASSSTRRETLSITDNRTGKAYEVPITHGAIRAVDLRQLRVDPADFGMISYDPAYSNTASCISRITYIDGDAGILRYRGYPIEAPARVSRSSGRGRAASPRAHRAGSREPSGTPPGWNCSPRS